VLPPLFAVCCWWCLENTYILCPISLCQRTTIFMIQNLVEALCEWNIRCCWLYAWKCYKGKRWSVVFLIFFNLFVEWLALLTVLLCSCRKLIGFTILLWCGWWERTEKLAH
jgi:hypothetical protein